MDWIVWAYRQVYSCKRSIIKNCCPKEDPYDEPFRVHADSLPWFWIGMVYPDKTSITVTDIINCKIRYGMRVTPEYLTKATGYTKGVWMYIDSKTLEEREFPSEGFVIEDVLDKSVSDSE